MDNVSEISFTADGDAIRAALEVVKTVAPGAVTQDGLAAYLFVVGKKVDKREDGTTGPNDGKDVCWVYSQNATQGARSEFYIDDVQGEGAFAYMQSAIATLDYPKGKVTFNCRSDRENSAFTVRYAVGDGAFLEEVTIDPKQLTSMDKRLAEATDFQKYPKVHLAAAVKAGKTFLSKDTNAKDEHKIINLYDSTSKGDGNLCSTDGTQRFYFACDAFKGTGLQIHSDHIGLLESFLSKVGSEVIICNGANTTYAMSPDRSRVVGWQKHTKPALEFKIIPKSWDKVVLQVSDREQLIAQLKWTKSAMKKGYDKIKIEFNQTEKSVRFHIQMPAGKMKSQPIDVVVQEFGLSEEWKAMDGQSPGFASDVNVDKLLDLFSDLKAKVVEFRMLPFDQHGGPKGSAGFRTVDEFLLDPEGKVVGGSGAIPDPANGVHTCKVMRFMSSKV